MKSLKKNDPNLGKNLKTINGKPTDEEELARVNFQYIMNPMIHHLCHLQHF